MIEQSRRWTAVMVAADEDFAGAPLLRGEVALDGGHGGVVTARLLTTAHGVVEAYVGRERNDLTVLSPGWSAYEWRLRYRDDDVTAAVARAGSVGEPVIIGLALGNGWYRGHLGFAGNQAIYGSELAGLAELVVTYADGHVQIAGTDTSWRSGPSATTKNDLYMGQTIDGRLRDDSWLSPGADVSAAAGWCGVHIVERDPATLVPYVGPPVRRQSTVTAQRIWTAPSGRTIVDFGQNLVGWVRLRVPAGSGAAGNTVTVRHAEVLQDGELATRPLMRAEATDRFILSGGEDTFEPSLTYHGFRYADLDGYPGALTGEAIQAVVVHSDLERIGTFECSDPLLNRLHQNVVWSQRGNFLDLPTDCPQRSERLGWTGDIAVFASSAAYLFDVGALLGDWLLDLEAEQAARDGLVPYVVPDTMKYEDLGEFSARAETTAIWSDASAWVPWALWQAYGDLDALRRQYPAMAAHTRREASLFSANGLWDTGFQFGDWLDPTAPPENPFLAKADNGVVATASAFRTLAIASWTAALLGRRDDEAEFAALRDRTKAAFLEHYVSADGLIHSDCQTVYALAIVFDLLDDGLRHAAGLRLAELVEKARYRVSTGFAGTPFVLDALTITGHLDAAYRMLTETECPSWLYPVTMGATTIWERWDSMLPDGTVNPGEMTSFNHYALGAVADWMHRTIGGISPLEPGYSKVLVAPRPGGGITWARASLRTPHGTVTVSWSLRQNGPPSLTVDAPEGIEIVVDRP